MSCCSSRDLSNITSPCSQWDWLIKIKSTLRNLNVGIWSSLETWFCCLIIWIFYSSGHPQVSPPACNFCIKCHSSVIDPSIVSASLQRGFGGHWDSQIPSYVSHHLFLIHPSLLAVGSYSTAVKLRSSEIIWQKEATKWGLLVWLLSRVQPEHLKEAPQEEPTVGAVQLCIDHE